MPGVPYPCRALLKRNGLNLNKLIDCTTQWGMIAIFTIAFNAFGGYAHAWAQPTHVSYEHLVSFTAPISNANIPFWLAANRFGVADPMRTAANYRFKAMLPHKRETLFSYAAGADLVGRVSDNSSLFLQQFYGELKLGPFLLRAGRKEESRGVEHPAMSLGSTTMGSNAAPITKISLSWPDYVTVPKTGSFLAVKGYLGHGWIEGRRVVSNVLLHEKTFYLRLGFDDWPVHGYAGLQHYTMWGGVHRQPNIGDLPSSFNDFLRVLFIQGASSKDTTLIDGEITNVLGNSIGAYDFKLEVRFKPFLLRIYRQFYLEDTVSLAFRNAWDGLWGVQFHFPHRPLGLSALLYEHVNTKKQGSKEDDAFAIGTDNYYNHFVYESGWTHRGRTISLPVVTTLPGFTGNVSNILLSHHLGVEGQVQAWLDYTLLFTYSRNYGAHYRIDAETIERIFNTRFTPPRHQYSTMLELRTSLPAHTSLTIFIRMAYDWGEWLPDRNFGFTIGLKHRGAF